MSVNFISNFICQKISDKYKLDSSQVVFLSTVFTTFLLKFKTDMFIEYVSLYKFYVFLIFVIGGGFFAYKKNNKNQPKYGTKAYNTTRIFDCNKYSLLRFMMDKHPNFWSVGHDIEIGNPFYPSLSKFFTPQENQSVNFHDEIHKVKGCIVIRSVNPPSSDDPKNAKPVRCIDLSIENGSLNGDEYLNKLESYRDSFTRTDNTITLYMVKVMCSQESTKTDVQNHTVTMYKGPKNNQQQRYNDYMLSYFSEHRDKLWKYFSNIHFHPEKFRAFGQEARANMLLYGPPGTGKSAFAYRLAMSLGRHIVSVDLTAVSSNKASVYQIIQRASIEGIHRNPQDYIVLLEEFDIAVMHLHKKKNSKPTYDLSSYYSDYLERNVDEKDENENENEDEKDKKPRVSYGRSAREFELEDLLEILQGPVPIPGSIILATTNKYEEMLKICPALFRPGRLTPVEFGNMNWASLQEMTKHYFGKELIFSPVEKINIPTSDIVENALNSSLYGEEGFAMFESFLKKKTILTN